MTNVLTFKYCLTDMQTKQQFAQEIPVDEQRKFVKQVVAETEGWVISQGKQLAASDRAKLNMLANNLRYGCCPSSSVVPITSEIIFEYSFVIAGAQETTIQFKANTTARMPGGFQV